MNTYGKLRLSRWYVNYNDNDQQKLITELHRLLVSRGTKYTNFIEVAMSDPVPQLQDRVPSVQSFIHCHLH